MENKIIFKDKELKKTDDCVLGISGENEQEVLVFCFEDGFVDGVCDLDIEFPNGKKGCIENLEKDRENECYKLVVKSGLLRYEGVVKMQLKVVQKTKVWKCKDFEMFVLEAINAVETIEEQYPTWAERITIRVSELEKGVKQIGEKVDGIKVLTKLSELENDVGFSDFSGDYEDLRNKPEIPSVEGLATEEFVVEKINGIDVPSVEGLASEAYVDEKLGDIESLLAEV